MTELLIGIVVGFVLMQIACMASAARKSKKIARLEEIESEWMRLS